MSLLTMELQVSTRTRGTIELRPDPKADAITALFYCFQSENEDIIPNGRSDDRLVGCLAVGDETFAKRLGKTPYKLEVVEDENTLINRWIDMVQKEFDPEIVAGYEVHYSSWGYLIERARLCYGDQVLCQRECSIFTYVFFPSDWDIVNDLGRMISNCTGSFGTKDTDRWGFNETSTLNFTGRHVISIWRVLKADNKLLQNSFEHVVINILRRRTPHFSFETLTQWYNSKSQQQLARVFAYWINRVEMDVELLEESEDISKNCEFARIYGVDFRSVRLRGSQFKVEAVMFRIAKPESFLLLSVTRQEVGRQNAAECQPLIMEPKSGFYTSPLIVLDFQSLYPSVMIAYNYCYSTCMGRIGTYKGTTKLGTTSYDPPPGLLSLMKDDLIISPNGMAFVPATVRKSLLAKMLAELLDSRVMVKSGMKGAGGNKALLRLLNGRQLALKLLANVTYGYTSATFSGRMPCVEIADAIVQTGRETLERAIETVRSNAAWGAEVVYGDTDSLFIYLPGKSKADAFKIGQEIADKVTSQNPRPIKLKFEKVYLPSCLLAKKRYVGWCYETEKVKEPAFDAKGIETVRRDGFMAQQKLMESALKTLFRTADLSQVKAYVQRQWSKLEAGDVSPQDFTFAKAVKLGSYSDKRPPPPGAAVASRLMDRDPRAEISYGERVPYLLFEAEPETRQVDRALSPDEFLADSRLRLDAPHYIGAMIKVLNRIFNHVGVDVQNWYTEMPKVKRLRASATTATGKKALLDEHFTSSRCIACDGPDGNGSLCKKCLAAPDKVLYSVKAREREATTRQLAVHKICASCEGTPQIENITCDSLDCPTLYSRSELAQNYNRTHIDKSLQSGSGNLISLFAGSTPTSSIMYTSFAIAGTGGVGSHVIAALASQPNVSVVVLSRSASAHLPDNTTLKTVDYSSYSTLVNALIGIQVVISTLNVEGIASQYPLADAAKDAGVRLFVPSDFGSPTDGLVDGPRYAKVEFVKYLETLGLPYTRFYTGAFSDQLFPLAGFDFANGKVRLIGAGDTPITFTTRPDVANFLSYALTHLPPSQLQNVVFRLQGDLRTMNEVVEVYQRTHPGKILDVSVVGRTSAPGGSEAEVSADALFRAAIQGLITLRKFKAKYRARGCKLDVDSGRPVSTKGKVSFYHSLKFEEKLDSASCMTQERVRPSSHNTPPTSPLKSSLRPTTSRFDVLAAYTNMSDSSEMDTSSSGKCLVTREHEKVLTRERRQARRHLSQVKDAATRAGKLARKAAKDRQDSDWNRLQQQDLGLKTRGDRRRAACEGLI
ncbi:DNA polymerase zeta, partial [Phenoliferia sp. Uapishka_3]